MNTNQPPDGTVVEAMSREELADHVARHGSVSALARALGTSVNKLSLLNDGRKPIGQEATSQIRALPLPPVVISVRQARAERTVDALLAPFVIHGPSLEGSPQ